MFIAFIILIILVHYLRNFVTKSPKEEFLPFLQNLLSFIEGFLYVLTFGAIYKLLF